MSARVLSTHHRGLDVLREPLLNKDLAFTVEERGSLGLTGLLPAAVLNLEQQVVLELQHLDCKGTDLERHVGLAALQDRNETLFYRLLLENLSALMPIVYTPTVGLACQSFSHILRRARGIWLTPEDLDCFPRLLQSAGKDDVRLVVVTDNERILGLGDQGAGGMGIPIGKLALYSAAAGIHPRHCLPISLDFGTDNSELLADPLYLGYRKARIRGRAYDELIDAFVRAIEQTFPRALLQWEDFGQHNSFRLLDRYRRRLPSFNDDIQGTAAVALAGILSGLRITGERLEDQRIVYAGAGSSAIGIARLLRTAILEASGDESKARRAQVLCDRGGLLTDRRADLMPHQAAFALTANELDGYGLRGEGPFGLVDVVRAVKPSILIGASGTAGLFTHELVSEQARGVERPLIFVLSNPTANAECTPEQALEWSGGRALVATGSPFPAVRMGSAVHRIGQANNVFIFPGVGLGALVAEAREVSERMFLVAAQALAAAVNEEHLAAHQLYPSPDQLRLVTVEVAAAVVRQARAEGLGRAISEEEIKPALQASMWFPEYAPIAAV